MPFELGGRSDKDGNRYEIKTVVYQLLKVLEEKIEYVVLEALGDDEKGVDIWVEHKDGRKEGQQCKGRNGSKEYWDFGTANAKNIFSNWRFQLNKEPSINVSLVSPLAFTLLEDLIRRASNTSESSNDFYAYQVLTSSKELIAFFKNFCRVMDLNPEIEQELTLCISYLKRIHYRQVPDSELSEIIFAKIGYLFFGDEKDIYDQFVSWVVDGDILGKKITHSVLYQFIKDKKMNLKKLSLDDRIIPRLHALNQEYQDGFMPLNNGLFKRDEFLTCRDALDSGQSLIIHGKAGRGKSGCTEDIIQYCRENNMQYLAIKLDKRIPSGNTEKWGQELGLPASIVHCLHSVTKEEKAVIILDQLDALRWTQAHSRDSLLVCSEIINQVIKLNIEREHNISIVFVCRTIDLENDNNIRQLFKENELEKDKINWQKVKISELDNNKVQDIVGNHYEGLTRKLKDLLRIPSNLFIWQRLDPNGVYGECSTTNHLISKWWYQLVEECFKLGLNEDDLNTTKEKLIEQFDKLGRIYVPLSILKVNKSALDFLNSNSFLIIQENKIFFAHQSILDYFLAEKMLQQYYDGVNILDIVGNKEKQTPGKRYQLQMLMQSLIEIDSQDFIEVGKQLLNEESIRYYNKYVFFEIMNQIENVDINIENFIIEYCEDKTWGKHIINNVINMKPQYFKILRDTGIIDKWFNSPEKKEIGLSLLISIRPRYEMKDIELIEKYGFQSEEDARSLFYCFSQNINEDTDEMFEIRMRFYNQYPKLVDSYIDYKSSLKNCELRAIRYFAFLLDHKIKKNEKSIHRYENEFFCEDSELLIENGEKVIELLLPFVPKELIEEYKLNDWSGRYNKESLERVCINILKKANATVVSLNPEIVLNYYRDFMGRGINIINELILDALYKFPETYSDYVITYLCDDFERNIFDKTSGNRDELLLFKLILEKHSPHCSQSVFEQLENKIVYYISPRAKDILQSRIDFNKEKNGDIVYWSFWGDLQYELFSVLPLNKVSNEVKNLMNVLERKFEKGTALYKYSLSHGGWVSSPIAGKQLTVNNWLKIIVNKKVKQRNHTRWVEVPGGFVESSTEQFSRSFNDAVLTAPEKMIKLILSLKECIDDIYIDSLFSGVAYSKSLNSIPKELIEEMFLRYSCDSYSFRAASICTIIEKRDDVEWSKEVLDILLNIAINHRNPETNKPNVTNNTDKEMHSYDMLFSNAINCVRGSAAQAIGHLLWNNSEYFTRFKNIIERLSRDSNPAVRLSSLFALLPSFNIDREWTTQKIISLYEQDYRLAGFYKTKHILFLLYPEYRESVLNIIKKCYYSDDKDLIEMGAYCLSEMYILKNEFVNEMTNVKLMSETQAEKVLYMVMLYFDKNEYNNLVKEIIYRFKKSKLDLEIPMSKLFYDNLIDLDRDKDFLLNIMCSDLSSKILHVFVDYLEEESKSLIDFQDIIISWSYHLIDNIEDIKERAWGIDDAISKLVIGLYDDTSTSTQLALKDTANECLDVWDKMFEKQIGSARRLSREMMER